MRNICILRKYAAILALSVCSIVSAFAQGAVTGYAAGGNWIKPAGYTYTDFPTNAQFQRLTHVIASDIGCYTLSNVYKGLWINQLPDSWNGLSPHLSNPPIWNGNTNKWLLSLVSRAHTEGVKAILCVGGGKDSHAHWKNATSGDHANSSSNISKFVSDIVSFVNLHGFDGVDIDCESASTFTSTEWDQLINLLNALKNHSQLSCKRISVALPHGVWFYPSPTYQQDILDAIDAIHLMSYDVEDGTGGWPSHSSAAYSNGAIDYWLTSWGAPNSYKKKLHLACAFYGYKKNGSTTLWGNANKVGYATYSGGGNYNPGDTPGTTGSAATKVNHCYTQGYGGVFAWELGYDANTSTTPTLLNAIWVANNAKGGYVPEPIYTISGTATLCPTGTYKLHCGAASQWVIDFLSSPFAEFSITSSSPFSATVQALSLNGEYGVLIALDIYGLPIAYKAIKACISPPVISGLDVVCNSTTYTLLNGQASAWSITQSGSVFSLSSNGNTATVTATANAPYATATLNVTVNGTVYSKTIENCAIKGSNIICSTGFYELSTGESAIWSLSNGSNYFNITPLNNNLQAQVTTGPTGKTATITAVTSSKTYYLNIESCLAMIVGPPPNICSSSPPVTFYTNIGTPAGWITGGPFKIVSTSGNSCTVQATANDGSNGTIIAIYGTAGAITKTIYATCSKGAGDEEPKLDAYVTAYPNPASDILYIEIDATAHALQLQSKSIATVPTYEVRLLDHQAISRHQTSTKGGTVQFNLSSLPIGVYYLLVQDGISVPLLRQIIVEH